MTLQNPTPVERDLISMIKDVSGLSEDQILPERYGASTWFSFQMGETHIEVVTEAGKYGVSVLQKDEPCLFQGPDRVFSSVQHAAAFLESTIGRPESSREVGLVAEKSAGWNRGG